MNKPTLRESGYCDIQGYDQPDVGACIELYTLGPRTPEEDSPCRPLSSLDSLSILFEPFRARVP